MSALEALKAARELISEPDRWTQKFFARDKDGAKCDFDSNDAVCFCMLGAIKRVSRYGEWQPAFHVLRDFTPHGVAHFNDTRTHSEVLGAFDRAIAKLEAGS